MAAEPTTSEVQRRERSLRYRQIVEILTRHGLGFAIGALTHDARRTPRADYTSAPQAENGERASASTAHLGGPEHLRLALQELGPTFIKLGQILSTRGDLLPHEYRDELALLQDATTPIPEDDVRAILAREMNCPLDDVFASFDMKPLASASIGQAHAAILLDGSDVVVKLRRPHVVEQVEADLQILYDLAQRAAKRWSAAQQYDLQSIVQEFAQTLRREMDYTTEAHNVERIADNFRGETGIHIPRVYWKTTTSRMLTLERVHGVKFTDTKAIEALGLDRSEIAHRSAWYLLTMILDHRFFHADPHPGNVLIEQDGRIGLIDFGMVGEVDESTSGLLLQLMIAIAYEDASRLADTVLDIGVTRVSVDRNALRRDLQHLLRRYGGRSLGDVRFGAMLGEMLDIIRWHHLRLPADLALLVKTLAMGEGLAAELDPSFNLLEVYLPLAETLTRRQFDPRRWLRQMEFTALDATQMSLEVPQKVRRILSDIERGGFEVTIQRESFAPALDRLEALVNRVILALFSVASLITGGILVASAHATGQWDAVTVTLLALTLLGATGLGLLLLPQLWRPRRGRY